MPKQFENPERITDIEFATRLIQHIEQPCEDEYGNNVRHVYINEAKRILDEGKILDPEAVRLLSEAIEHLS